MSTHKSRFILTTLTAFAAALVLLFGSAAISASAAQSALPGDALYPFKTGLESTQLTLTRDAYDQAQLALGFAGRRLDEMATLISVGRFSEIDTAAQEYQSSVQQAIDSLETVSAGDPARAQALTSEIAESLSRYEQTLSDMLVSLPETVRPAVEQAIDASQPAGSAGQSDDSAADNQNENANDGGNANDDNGNANDDGNENEDDGNANDDNGNTNDDDSNANDDDGNANDDDGNTSDDNSNANDDNGNANDDDTNTNDGGIGNANDDDGNKNDDDDENENEGQGLLRFAAIA